MYLIPLLIAAVVLLARDTSSEEITEPQAPERSSQPSPSVEPSPTQYIPPPARNAENASGRLTRVNLPEMRFSLVGRSSESIRIKLYLQLHHIGNRSSNTHGSNPWIALYQASIFDTSLAEGGWERGVRYVFSESSLPPEMTPGEMVRLTRETVETLHQREIIPRHFPYNGYSIHYFTDSTLVPGEEFTIGEERSYDFDNTPATTLYANVANIQLAQINDGTIPSDRGVYLKPTENEETNRRSIVVRRARRSAMGEERTALEQEYLRWQAIREAELGAFAAQALCENPSVRFFDVAFGMRHANSLPNNFVLAFNHYLSHTSGCNLERIPANVIFQMVCWQMPAEAPENLRNHTEICCPPTPRCTLSEQADLDY